MLLSALAIIGMGTMSVACSPRTEKPSDAPNSNTGNPSTGSPSANPEPTEKGMRTNVTRSPMSVAPNGGGNPAVPCGFGPAGGGPCGNNN